MSHTSIMNIRKYRGSGHSRVLYDQLWEHSLNFESSYSDVL